jgi:dihydroflavonol-4-reductase
MRAFITGAASPLGRALVTALVRRGHRVVGQVRRRSGLALLKNLGAEPVLASLADSDKLMKGMRGCDAVYHVATFFDLWARSDATFEAVNVEGAKNVIAAAIVAKVPRLVFASSAATIGEAPGDVGHEWTSHRGHTLTAFERSKLTAERAALKLREKGIEIVIVNPALVVAPGDTGWTGRLIAGAVSGRRWFASEAPMGWVWVGDAAAGLVLAHEKGKNGERYILCGDTMSPRDFLGRIARIAGVLPPFALPRSLAFGGAALSTALATPFGRRPRISMDEARFATRGFRVDGSFATTELGLTYTPIGKYLPQVVQSYRKALTRFAA